MKTKHIIGYLVGFVALIACASAETIKLKLAPAQKMLAALSALEGTTKIVDQGKNDQGQEQVAKIVIIPFELSGRTRLKIARDRAALQLTIDAHLSKLREDAGKISPKEADKPGVDPLQKCLSDPALAAKLDALWEHDNEPLPTEVELFTIAELKLDNEKDVNPFSTVGLEALLPLIAAK